MKGTVSIVFAAAALLVLGQTRHAALAADKLELHVTPTVSMAPASVLVRATVQHDAENRELEIIADSSDFFRRSVVDLDGERAPTTTELKLVDIPGGEYEVRATLLTAHGERTTVRKSIMVTSLAAR